MAFKDLAYLPPLATLRNAKFGNYTDKKLFACLCSLYDYHPDVFIETDNFAYMNTNIKDSENNDIYAYFEHHPVPGRQKWILRASKKLQEIEQFLIQRNVVPYVVNASGVYSEQIEHIDVRNQMRVLLDKYREEHCPTERKDGVVFGRLINALILEYDNPDCTNDDILDYVCVDAPQDIGLDGICIKVNGRIVSTLEELHSFIVPNVSDDREEKIENVEFILIQSKFKDKFDLGEFSKFTNGIRQFLEITPYRPMNPKVRNWFNIKNEIVSSEIFDIHITVRIYYAAYSDWSENQHPDIMGDLEILKNDIIAKDPDIFKVAKPVFLDSKNILEYASHNIRSFSPEIIINGGRIDFTGVDNFDGIAANLNATELIKIIEDETTKTIKKGLFDENVRDYLGETPVNKSIMSTIKHEPEMFSIRNNGITILVEKVGAGGNGFNSLKLSNPQIVNGCQTCNVIYRAYKKDKNSITKVQVFVRIIRVRTKNVEAIQRLISANNSANQITGPLYEISRPYHQELETEFMNYKEDNPEKHILYERRSHSLDEINFPVRLRAYQKCKFKDLLQSAITIWFNTPISSRLNEKKLLKDYKGRIFLDGHSKKLYYASASLFANYERLIVNGFIPSKYRMYKPHICLMIKYTCLPEEFDINGDIKKAENTSEKILNLISNENEFREIVDAIIEVFDEAQDDFLRNHSEYSEAHYDYRHLQDSEFNKCLLRCVREKFISSREQKHQETEPCYSGIVRNIRKDKNGNFYMHIEQSSTGELIFAHQGDTSHLDFSLVNPNMKVIFEKKAGAYRVIGGERIPVNQAKNVQIDNS